MTRFGVLCSLLIVVIAVVQIFCVWPGIYTWDSFESWRQGYTGTITNWQSPLHSMVLGIPTRYGVPLWYAFALQAGAFSAVMVALVLAARSKLFQASVVLFFALPTTMALFTTMWRDSMAMICLLFWLLCWRKDWFRWGLLALTGVVLFRLNAVIMVPMLVWLSVTAAQMRNKMMATVAITLCIGLSPWVLNRACGVEDAWPIGSTRMHELNAITIQHPIQPSKNFIRNFATKNQQKNMHNKCGVWGLVNSGIHEFEATELGQNRAAIEASWWTAVEAHPAAWLQVRARMARCILRVGYGKPDRPYRTARVRRHNNVFDYRTVQTPTLGLLYAWRDIGKQVFFFPFVWVISGILLLPFMRIRLRIDPARHRTSIIFLLAGAACEFGLFLTAPTADHRYSTPMEWAVFFAWASWLEAGRLAAKPDRSEQLSRSLDIA